jgi:hypothetical protein
VASDAGTLGNTCGSPPKHEESEAAVLEVPVVGEGGRESLRRRRAPARLSSRPGQHNRLRAVPRARVCESQLHRFVCERPVDYLLGSGLVLTHNNSRLVRALGSHVRH